MPIGPLKDRITIHMVDTGRPFFKYEIPVSGRVVGEVEARPKSVFFGMIPVGTTAQKSCEIVSRTGERLKFVSASSSSNNSPVAARQRGQVEHRSGSHRRLGHQRRRPSRGLPRHDG